MSIHVFAQTDTNQCLLHPDLPADFINVVLIVLHMVHCLFVRCSSYFQQLQPASTGC